MLGAVELKSLIDSEVRPAAFAYRGPRAIELAASPAIEAPRIRLHLLGAMEASTVLGNSVLPRSHRACALLAIICMADGKPVRRSKLAGLIWDRVTEAQARASLRKALSEIGHAFGGLFDQVIEAGRDHVAIKKDKFWVDAVMLQKLDLRSEQHQSAEYLMCARGELLEGMDGISASFDSWLRAERGKFYNQISISLDKLLNEPGARDSQPDALIRIARQLIAVDSTNERAWQLLIQGLLDQGDRGQALREYGRCAQALRELLDAEPSDATRKLAIAARVKTRLPSLPIGQSAPVPGKPTSRPRLRVAVLPSLEQDNVQGSALPSTLPLEIATALARFRWFDAISPQSFGDGTLERPAIYERLKSMDLDYFIDFRINKNAATTTVLVRLNKVGETFDVVWDDRIDTRIADSNDFDNLIAQIVARIDPVILLIESKSPYIVEYSSSNNLVMRAVPLMYSLVGDRYTEAHQLLAKALEIEPKNSMALAWLAFWWAFNMGQGWAKDPGTAIATAEKLCIEAIDLDPLNAQALGIYGHICSFYHKDFERGQHHLDQALHINPNVSFLWALSAATSCYIGEPKKAIASLDRYKELAPFDPFFKLFETMYTMAYLFDRNFEQAVRFGRRTVSVNPEFVNGYKPLISALGHLGAKAEAGKYLRDLLAREPDFSVQRFVETYPFRRPEDRDNYVTGLRLAGAPEHQPEH